MKLFIQDIFIILLKKKINGIKIRTHSVTCKIDYEDLQEILKNKRCIVLSALPKDCKMAYSW